MIGHLRGRVHDKQPNLLVVDVGGVGYEVHVPLSTYYEVGEVGDDVSLRIHTHVREDAFLLYGFITSLEQEVFERLIATSGIGPKLAVAVLSGIEPGDFVRAVQAGDAARLTLVPGVGKKTAERIVLELKDRLEAVIVPQPPVTTVDTLRVDLLSALHNLGYHRPLTESAVDAVVVSGSDATFEQALRDVLRALTR